MCHWSSWVYDATYCLHWQGRTFLRMGNIDDAVPFFGRKFNSIYPLIMVVYTIAVASNFFGRVISYFGNWKITKVQSEEAEDIDGFDTSGLIILQRERTWLEQGHQVGGLIVPLARNFNNSSLDIESVSSAALSHEKTVSSRLMEDGEALNEEAIRNSFHDGVSGKYKAIETGSSENIRDTPNSLYEADNSQDMEVEPSSGSNSTWESVKNGFRSFKTNFEAGRFIPLRQVPEARHSDASPESLDDIFERIKKPSADSTHLWD